MDKIYIIGLLILPVLIIRNEYVFLFVGLNVIVASVFLFFKKRLIIKAMIVSNVLIGCFVLLGILFPSPPFVYCHKDFSGTTEHCHQYFEHSHNH